VDGEKFVAVVTEEDGAGTVVGELVCACAADADGRVCAWCQRFWSEELAEIFRLRPGTACIVYLLLSRLCL